MSEVYGFKIEVEGSAIKSIQGIDAQLHKLEVDSRNTTTSIGNHFSNMNNKMKSMFGGMGGLLAGATGLGFLFGGVSLAKASLEAFDKREESLAKLNAALKSTGSIAGLTAEELERMAGKQSGGELFSKSAIEDAQSMLLTFTSVRGVIFDKAMPAISDFATRFKMELPEAANMVGKALNDPLKGMTRLQRQGVVFSEQQKEQIQNFMMQGKVAEAQGVILKELNVEFGGLAEAMTRTDAGKLKMVNKELTEMKLTIGSVLSKALVGLTPIIEGIGNLFHKVFKKDLASDLEDSRIEMNSLFKELSDSNLGMEDKQKIMALLNTQYKEYLPYLLTDKMSEEDRAKALNFSNDAMIKKIELQAIEEINEEALNEYKKAHAKYLRATTELNNQEQKFKSSDFDPASHETKMNDPDYKRAFEKQNDAAADNYRLLKNVQGLLDKSGISANFKSQTLDEIMQKIQDMMSKAKKPKGGPLGLIENSTDTSLLGGASGGLGEAKTIKIDFHAPMMQINVPGGNGLDIVAKADMTAIELLRILNNIAYSQGTTM